MSSNRGSAVLFGGGQYLCWVVLFVGGVGDGQAVASLRIGFLYWVCPWAMVMVWSFQSSALMSGVDPLGLLVEDAHCCLVEAACGVVELVMLRSLVCPTLCYVVT